MNIAAPPLVDLEEMAQQFVLETKQLQIPGHPTACNPSIIRLGNRFLLSFDPYVENSEEPDRIGLVWLNEDFDVMGEATILGLPRPCSLIALEVNFFLSLKSQGLRLQARYGLGF